MRLALTRRADYGVRAMIELARASEASGAAGDDRSLSAARIAAVQGIPPQILPGIMRQLVRAGLLEVALGRSGGYRLARPAMDVSILDVVEAIEGGPGPRLCVLRGEACSDEAPCAVDAVFLEAQRALRARLQDARLGPGATGTALGSAVASGS